MAAPADQNGRRASRLEERRLLADLTDFPSLAAVLAFEETWKKNNGKKKKKNKKRKIECQGQIVTEEQHQEPGQMAITEGLKHQQLVVLSDGGDEEVKKGQSCKMDGKDTVPSMEVQKRQERSVDEEERGNNVGVGIADDHRASNGHKSKMDEYRMLADLSDFPNLAAMLNFEENWKKDRKRNKKKKKKQQRKTECEIQHDMEEYHSGEKPIIGGQKFQDLLILPEKINGEVMQKSQSCERVCKGTVESIEVKKQESCRKEERGNNVGVGIADHKVSIRHISKADEYRMLADLTDYPNLATMLAFEATRRQNRKKKNNKRRKVETRVENDMEQHHQKPVRVAATEELNRQDLVILLDSSDNEGMKSDRTCEINSEDTTELSKGKKPNISKDKEEKGDNIGVESTNHEVSSGQMSKADQYKQAAMLNVEATVRKNRKEDKERRKFEFQVLPNLTDAAKGETQKTTGKAKAFNADDSVRSAVIIDLCSSEEEEEKLIADHGSPKVFREMVPADTTRKRKVNRNKAPKDTVNILEEGKKPDSSKELIPFQVKPGERMDEIIPRKLLGRRRYFHQPESSRRMPKDDHSAIKNTMQKWKKPCYFCGSSKHNALNCKQVIGCFFCCGSGHLAIDCPQKHAIKDEHSKVCLKCGNSGHDLSSCNDEYSRDDLKKIQCFHCKAFGHLGCVDYKVEDQRQVSC